MVTLISESFYNSLEPKPELLDISDFILDIVGANGSNIPYRGYFGGDVFSPDILENCVLFNYLIINLSVLCLCPVLFLFGVRLGSLPLFLVAWSYGGCVH
jgi:hypothetical protein